MSLFFSLRKNLIKLNSYIDSVFTEEVDEKPRSVSNQTVEEKVSSINPLPHDSGVKYSYRDPDPIPEETPFNPKPAEHIEVRYSDRESPKTHVKFDARGDGDNYNFSVVETMLRNYGLISPEIVKKNLRSVRNLTFVEKLQEIIRSKSLRDSQVYKPVDIDRRLYSKMMSDVNYKPAKDTAIALCLSLHLLTYEAKDLLERAGYTLSHSDKRDIVIEYCFQKSIYKIHNVNSLLQALDLKILGRQMSQ